MVSVLQGSGARVLDESHYTIEALPYILQGAGDWSKRYDILNQLLGLRRSLVVAAIGSIKKDKYDLTEAKDFLEKANESRNDLRLLATYDMQMIRSILHSTGLLPWLWVWNSVARVYVDLVAQLPGPIFPLDEYYKPQLAMITSIEQGHVNKAVTQIESYMLTIDEKILKALQSLISITSGGKK